MGQNIGITDYQKESFKKFKEDLLKYQNGDVFITDVEDIHNTYAISKCIITLSCKKCNASVKKEYYSFTSWQRRNENKTRCGCQVCNTEGLTSRLEVGLVSYNRTLVAIKRKDEFKKSLQTAKFTLKCNWCNSEADYSYGKTTSFFNTEKTDEIKVCCPNCRFENLEDENYKQHIGKVFGIFTVEDVITKHQNSNKIIFKAKCKCGAIHEKTIMTLRNAKKHNFKTCNDCKPKTVNRIFDKDIDLTDKEINIYKVNKYIGLDNKHKRVWDCICRCGNHSEITTGRLSGMVLYPTSTCRYCKKSVSNDYKVGDIYKNRKILSMEEQYAGDLTYICLKCGSTHTITKAGWATYMRSNEIESCHKCCDITHGDSIEGFPIYNFYIRWITLKTKFSQKEIKFDPRWDDYLNFKEDMYPTFSQISSIKCNSDYWSKETCYWETNLRKLKNEIKD